VSGAFAYAGQICISVQHVFVQDTIYDGFVAELTEGTRGCHFGDPAVRATVSGPMISKAAADRVEAWIAEAVAGGASVLVGGERRENVIAPCILNHVPPEARLETSEVFGPVLTVEPFTTIEAAIERVNGSSYGLQAGVFTCDSAQADVCYRQLRVGAVIVNDHPTLRFDNFPYGGVKRSGFGREGVAYAMAEMSEPRTRITRDLGGLDSLPS
jgi:acyl-CoA reductase-like NAD-dependent aldehyde dehydrogenase